MFISMKIEERVNLLDTMEVKYILSGVMEEMTDGSFLAVTNVCAAVLVWPKP